MFFFNFNLSACQYGSNTKLTLLELRQWNVANSKIKFIIFALFTAFFCFFNVSDTVPLSFRYPNRSPTSYFHSPIFLTVLSPLTPLIKIKFAFNNVAHFTCKPSQGSISSEVRELGKLLRHSSNSSNTRLGESAKREHRKHQKPHETSRSRNKRSSHRIKLIRKCRRQSPSKART